MSQYKRLPFLLIIFSFLFISYFVSSAAALHDDQIHDTPDVPFLDPDYVLPSEAIESAALAQQAAERRLEEAKASLSDAKLEIIYAQAALESATVAEQLAEQIAAKAAETTRLAAAAEAVGAIR